ncbi:MAG TPA: HAD-IA family hydrolase [Burkholderiales bacterium]|nr:HAD-IA family hydrolase [Burkholderiales bacterium]
MRIGLVIFDCDGVLVDSEPIANRVLVEQLHGIGVSIPESEVMRRFVGKTRGQCLALAAEILGRALPETFGAHWDAALFEALRNEVQPSPGMVDVLRRLTVPYCAASNGMPDRVRLTLASAGLMPYFEGRIFTSADVPNPKPAPDLFLHAAASMHAAPAHCVVIEDTPTGVRAARAAAMRVLGYIGGSASDAATLQREGAAAVFDDMSRLPALLRAQTQRSQIR